MQKQKSGHIINMASVFGIKVFAPGATVYCATKAAVRALTEGLRMELNSQNIRGTATTIRSYRSVRRLLCSRRL
jgi:NADP-dependent 3-hydroxy acid dehydrogenase YdfG